MKKTAIALFLVVQIEAQTYEQLLQQAIENSVNLQTIHNQQEQISLEGEIDRRYENPNLELEIADFSPQFIRQKNQFGTRIGISQSLPLPHILEDKKSITQNKIEVAQESYKIQKSKFIYAFNLRYLAYKKAKHRLDLAYKALKLSKDVLETVNKRYQEGAVAKSDQLEAKLDYKKIENQLESLSFKVSKAKNSLLYYAKSKSEEAIELEQSFILLRNRTLNPIIRLNEAKNRVSQAKIELFGHSVNSIEVFSELEQEPDQNIFRVGVSIALPTFNNREQEKQLEKIKIANQTLRIFAQKRAVNLQVQQLTNENRKLKNLRESSHNLISSQQELFDIYKRSYRISKVNLLKLQQSKEQQVLLLKKILEIDFALERNNIKINYLQGAYSE